MKSKKYTKTRVFVGDTHYDVDAKGFLSPTPEGVNLKLLLALGDEHYAQVEEIPEPKKMAPKAEPKPEPKQMSPKAERKKPTSKKPKVEPKK